MLSPPPSITRDTFLAGILKTAIYLKTLSGVIDGVLFFLKMMKRKYE